MKSVEIPSSSPPHHKRSVDQFADYSKVDSAYSVSQQEQLKQNDQDKNNRISGSEVGSINNSKADSEEATVSSTESGKHIEVLELSSIVFNTNIN
jgi:hypothetical protein